MKKKIAISIAASMSLLYGGANVEPASAPIAVEESPYYIYGMVGAHIQNIESKSVPDYPFVADALEDTGAAGEIGVGYKISDNIFAELAYQYQYLIQNDTHNLYASLNYNFLKSTSKYTPYVGVLAGYSAKHWREDPTDWYDFDRDSGVILYGAQLGLDVKLNQKASLRVKYQAVKLGHALDVYNTEDAIEHTFSQTLMAGVKYAF